MSQPSRLRSPLHALSALAATGLVAIGVAGFLPMPAGAQTTLTSVSQPTFAWVHGAKAVYLDYPGGKAAITELDLDSKAKKVLLPEAGASPWHIDFGYDGATVAYVLFTTRPQYPLEALTVATGAKKILDADAGWKESVWCGGGVAVWIDYRHKTANDKNGEVYLHDIGAGTGKRLTTNAWYQAKPATDGRHVVWLDYAGAGTKGQVVVYEIATGTVVTPSATDSHQDNPRVDGDWVVWEDYRNARTDTANADIYAYNLETKEVKVLCDKPGFQGRPFLQGSAVVWEDYRNAAGDASKVDIYGYDLSAQREYQITTRAGFDSSPVHSGRRLVWFGTDGAAMNLYGGELPFTATLVRGGSILRTDKTGRLYRPDGRLAAPSMGRVSHGGRGSALPPGLLAWP